MAVIDPAAHAARQKANLAALQAAITEQKALTFINPETATDEDSLGILLAKFCEWDGDKISQVFLHALEDSNYHTFAAEVQELMARHDIEAKL